MPRPIALLVCRAPALAEEVRDVLEGIDNLQLEVCSGNDQALREVKREAVVLVLADLGTVGGEAEVVHLLRHVAALRRACPTLVLGSQYDEPQVSALLRHGAADFLELPLDLDRLAHLADVLTLGVRWPGRVPGRMEDAACTPCEEPRAELVTADMGDLMAQIRRVAPQDSTLLLSGETGTGKTALAQLIHELSLRRTEPFLVVDCAALSGSLIESELFGHVKGAFTGADRNRVGKLAAAGAGTLLLDDINALPLNFQAKLLRAIGERRFEPVGAVRPLPVRARLIAASNVPLDDEVAAGRFRSDLFYRLNVVEFYLPPLRTRREAIMPMALRFLDQYASRNRLAVQGFRQEALEALEFHDWPGNVRELRNVVERGAALCEGTEIGLNDLPASCCEAVRRGQRPSGASATLNQSREEAEFVRIQEALRKHSNNRQRVAEELGISRMGLYKKLHKYGLIHTSVPPRGKKSANRKKNSVPR